MNFKLKHAHSVQKYPFFHFRWNSLRAGHVSIRAQEKTSPHILVLKTHATPTPALFMQKTPKKCQEKNFPREKK